jgi:hypothetical protein
MKYEWRKQEKAMYLPKEPTLVEVPRYRFLTLNGQGNPNRPEFSEQISALYMVAYALRMGLKKGAFDNEPFEYTVYPLEGVWTLPAKPSGTIDKNDLIYKIMIRQPEQVTKELAIEQKNQVIKKKDNRFLEQVQFEEYQEGLVVQACHIGPFDTEAETFAKMEHYCIEHQLKVIPTMGNYQHREIYLSDPRKSTPEKAKTVLRWRVETQDKNN